MYGISRTLTADEMSEFEALLDAGTTLPEIRLATSMASNGFKTFRVETEDEDPSYVVSLYPLASQVVSNDEAVKCECAAVVYNREMDIAINLSADQVDSSPFLPTARQAFHEGESYRDREAEYKYHFDDGTVEIAQDAANPVERLEDPVTFTAKQSLGGHFPRKWLLETEDGDCYYLRERSGSIRLIDDAGDGEHVFKAYVGGDHPGTLLYDDEILDMVFSMEYFELAEDHATSVSDEAEEAYYGDLREYDFGDTDDLDEEIEFDEGEIEDDDETE